MTYHYQNLDSENKKNQYALTSYVSAKQLYFKSRNIIYNVNINTVPKDSFIMILWFYIFEFQQKTSMK